MSKTRQLADLLDSNGDVKSGALDNAVTEVANTTTPVLTLTSPVNEKSVTNGTFTSATGSTTNIFASSGVISNINNVAKTFTYTAPEIVDTDSSNEDITITLTAVSKKTGELESLDGTLNISVQEVQVADDDAVSIASYQSSEFFNDGFDY
jgi:small nuclear ribonucleoprotein (snRNP)-like protein